LWFPAPADEPIPEDLGIEKYDEESAVSDRAGALLSLALVEIGEAVMPLFWLLDKEADVVFTVFQGRFGRLFHPSDSEEGNKEPDPDFPSKAVSARFWSSGFRQLWFCEEQLRDTASSLNQLTIKSTSQVVIAPDVGVPAFSSPETLAHTCMRPS
jgi:hypothetical protein